MYVSTPVVFPVAGESRQQNDNVQDGAQIVGGRVMPCQRAGFGSGGAGTAPKAQQWPFFRELQFIQEVLSWLEQSLCSVKFQDEIGI